MQKTTVLLIELKFHQEIIPSQLLFLASDKSFDTHVILNRQLYDEDLLGPFKETVAFELVDDVKSVWGKIKFALFLRYYIKKHNIQKIVFNTFESNFNQLLIKFLPPNLSLYAVLHQVHLLNIKPGLARMYKRLAGAFVLSDHTANFLAQLSQSPKKTATFYPIFFAQNIDAQENVQRTSLNQDVRIVIPGQMDLKKRDYLGLVDVVNHHRDNLGSIRFHLLGDASVKDGPIIIKKIKECRLAHFFEWETSFVSYDLFFDSIRNCDYIMPLLASSTGAVPYLTSQISASFNWAYGFQKTLLIEDMFTATLVEGMPVVSFKQEQLGDTLLNLQEPRETNHQNLGRLSFAFQAQSYINLLK